MTTKIAEEKIEFFGKKENSCFGKIGRLLLQKDLEIDK